MFSFIIRSTWLYLQYLVVFTQVATGWCHGWVGAQHGYHHDTKGKPEAATAVIELQMMGGKAPETCWAVNKRQDNKLENCCIWLVIYLNRTIYLCACHDSVGGNGVIYPLIFNLGTKQMWEVTFASWQSDDTQRGPTGGWTLSTHWWVFCHCWESKNLRQCSSWLCRLSCLLWQDGFAHFNLYAFRRKVADRNVKTERSAALLHDVNCFALLQLYPGGYSSMLHGDLGTARKQTATGLFWQPFERYATFRKAIERRTRTYLLHNC